MKKIFTLLILVFTIQSNAQLTNQSFENWENPLLHNTMNVSAVVPITGLGSVTVYICDDFDYNELENWSSTNQITKASKFGGHELVTQSPIAQDGTKSVRLESKTITINAFLDANCFIAPPTPYDAIENVAPALIVNGSFNLDLNNLVTELVSGTGLNALNPFEYPGVGEQINFIPKSISGYYQYTGAINPDTGNPDSCIIVSGVKKNGVIIGHVVTRLGDASSWTHFSVDYTHLNCDNPDTIITVISSSSIDLDMINGEFVINSDYTGADGSVLLLDKLHVDTMLLSEFPPILIPDVETVYISESATLSVLANDDFCDGGVYPPIIETTPSYGTITINVSNEIEYVSDGINIGTDVFTYYICNSMSLCDTTTVTINVTPVPICYANDDVRTLDLGVQSTDNFDPITNDVDCGTNFAIISGPSNGTAFIETNGSVTYSPNTGYAGPDEYDYTICSVDNSSQCDTATVKMTIISGINEIPENVIDMYPNPANTSLQINVDLNSEVTVSIFNTIGEKIISTSFLHSKLIDLKSLNNGLYFVEITANSKKAVRKLQVIK